MASSDKHTFDNFITVKFISCLILLALTNGVTEAASLNKVCIDDSTCTDNNQECSASSKCTCKDGYFTDQTTCRLPKHGEVCDSSVKCETGGGLVCTSTGVGGSTCQCSPAQYYTGIVCENKKGIGEACNGLLEPCFDQFECKSQVCRCGEDQFTPDNFNCQARKAFNASCSQTIQNECKANLICNAAACGCNESSQFYDLLTSLDCQPRKDYDAICSNIQNECKSTLACQSGKCFCSDDTQLYHDGSQCVQRKGWKVSCVKDEECQISLSCVSGNCDCKADEYYDGGFTQCLSRKNLYATCRKNENECKDPYTCDNGACGCPSTQYLNAGICVPKKPPNELCTRISTTDNQCQGSLSCISNKCSCDFNVDYIKGSECEKKKSFGQTCSISTSTNNNQCEGNLSCISQKCTCNSTVDYVEGSQCKTKKSPDEFCTSTTQCQGSLSCRNQKCTCDFTVDYRDGSECKTKKSHDESCTSTTQCQGSLSCRSLKCTCDFNVNYIEGSECKKKKSPDEFCTSTTQCQGSLSCRNQKCTCDFTVDYREGSQCKTRKNYQAFCNGNAFECLGTDVDCVYYKSNPRRCLCKANYFRTVGGVASCKSITHLQVQGPVVPTRTVSAVDFTWTTNKFGRSVFYRLKINPNEGSPTVTARDDGGSFTSLVGGRQYTFSVESYLLTDTYYPELSTTKSLGQFWTKPAKPGAFDLSLSQVKTNPMIFGFQPSAGDVSYYKVTLTHGTDKIEENPTTNTVTGLELILGETYGYEIVAVSGFGENSEKRSGTFNTSTAASGQVKDFDVTNIAATSVVAKWEPPETPNGEILAYAVQVFRKNTCQSAYIWECSDCSSSKESSFPECTETKTNNFLSNTKNFEEMVQSLTSYTEYTVKVFAINVAGPGLTTTKTLTTMDSAPENLAALDVTSFRNSSTGQVGLMATWTPGQKTGVTSYVVTLVKTMDDSVFSKQTLSGYDKTRIIFTDLLAFHEYEVKVVAETRLGKSDPIQKSITTKTTTPGKVQNFKINLDPKFATRMTLEFECPLESERNGAIQGFTVIKTTTSSGDEKSFDISTTDCTNIIVVESSQLESFVVNEKYSFVVIAKNQDYESSPSDPLVFNVVPKPPVFEKPVVEEDSNSVALENSVTVSLCSSCITNSNQGEVTYAGLIVCVKSKTNTCTKSRRKRDVLTLSTFSKYQTWTQAKASQFKSPYRTTPDGWIDTLKNDNPTVYGIGGDKTCSSDTPPTHCNGPLPSGKEIVVTVIACTVAGCQESSEVVVKTIVTDEINETDDQIGIIVGVVVSLFVFIMVIIAVCILMMRRQRRKGSPSKRQSKGSIKQPETPAPVQLEDVTKHERRPIRIRDFSDSVTLLHKDSNLLFQKEFEELKSISHDHESTLAQQGSNTFDSTRDVSRVKLQSLSRYRNDADLINASYIPGLNSKRDYIVTQGPLHGAIAHFWKMVWEQKTQVIVMLSDLTENNKTRVDLYWPISLKKPFRYGDVTVEMTSFSKLNKYIIRDFMICVDRMNRKVTHFFVPAWCEIGSVNLSHDDVIKFLQLVHEKMIAPDSGPPIIQCSAGVGRTGTFIALDYFMQYIERHGPNDDIDVFHYVLEMRKCRSRMVQAETQYIFIFDVLVEVIQRMMSEENNIYDVLQEENDYENQPTHEYTYQSMEGEAASVDNFYSNDGFDSNYEIP